MTSMRAVVYDRYGPPEVLRLEAIERPVPAADEVLVAVRAASVNPFDWHYVTGLPSIVRTQSGLRRPKDRVPGVDVAGVVAAVGSDVIGVQPGDAVFGQARHGAFAEYACLRRLVMKKPAGLSFEEAAAVPMAALTALQGLRDKGRVQPGQRVLINGASGGVGTFAVQIARALGAEVTAVCSTRNVEMVRDLGADHVVDYTSEDFTSVTPAHDLLLDMVGNRSLSERKHALTPKGTLVVVGGPSDGGWLRPLAAMAAVSLSSMTGSRRMVTLLAKPTRDDLATISELIESGSLRPVIDRRYALHDVPQAISYVGGGHARGKTVITV